MARLLARTRELLEALEAPQLAPFLAAWPMAFVAPVAGAASTALPIAVRNLAAYDTRALPVLSWLSHCAADANCLDPDLVATLHTDAPRLHWRQSYARDEVDAEFLDNYAWTELADVPGVHGRPGFACGMLILGPRIVYPPHRHVAEEIYVPLSGSAEWLQGDARWRRHAPGTLIHHRSEERHAMRTDDAPLLALYVWRGADMSPARLDLGRAG